MFENFKEEFISFLKSRLIVPIIFFVIVTIVLIARVFTLQIIRGEEYVANYELKIIREKSIDGTRGNIYDRNGKLLAYNVLSYDVKFEDAIESGKGKNAALNNTIYQIIEILQKNGDDISSDFKIIVNDDNEYEFSVEGTQLQRFLADIYGYKNVTELTYDQKNSTPQDVIDYFCDRKKFAIGYYENPNDKSTFIMGGGYTKQDIVRIIAVRYALSLTGYQKYRGITIATDVSEKSVAGLLEHSDILPGMSISQNNIRKYK